MTMVRNDGFTRRISYRRRLTISLMFLGLLSLMIGPVAFAHKVNIFAYVDGDRVYTESYFPDGTRVKDRLMEVYDSEGQKLLGGRTDENGEFHFKPPKKDSLEIVLLASMGHKNSYTILADELAKLQQRHVSFAEVIGGIGYIVGIIGIILYFVGKKGTKGRSVPTPD